MIWHEQKQTRPPEKFFLPMPDGFKQFFGHRRQRELIAEPFPAIDRDKVDFPARIHPQRNIVRQMLLAGTIHEGKVKPFLATSQSSYFGISGGQCRGVTPCARAAGSVVISMVARLALRGASGRSATRPTKSDAGRRQARALGEATCRLAEKRRPATALQILRDFIPACRHAGNALSNSA
jgi:hypothetical protein